MKKSVDRKTIQPFSVPQTVTCRHSLRVSPSSGGTRALARAAKSVEAADAIARVDNNPWRAERTRPPDGTTSPPVTRAARRVDQQVRRAARAARVRAVRMR